MSSLLDLVQRQLDAGAVQRISQQIGADPAATGNAIQMALPTLLGGLARNAQEPAGAESLNRALDDHTGTLDQVAGLLGGLGDARPSTGVSAASGPGGLSGLGGLGGAPTGAAPVGDGIGGALGGLLGGVGGKILGHILGGRREPVEQGIGRSTGLDAQQVGQLLAILAPIVMGVLARRKQQEGLDAGRLGAELQHDRTQLEQRAQQEPGGLLGGLLGQVLGGR